MRLLRQVRGAADDVVLAVLDFGDEGGAFFVLDNLHEVAHSHRIGAADAFQAEVAFYLAFDALAFVGLDEVPAACIFDDKPSHLIEN